MTLEQFIAAGETLRREAGLPEALHGYFRQHAARLFHGCERFQLFAPLGNVLEIGPFFGYTPFFLRPHSAAYTVLEGDDPAVKPLVALYRQRDIQLHYVDFFDLFGPVQAAPHRLAFPDATFDTVLCWETMEHFNFNPVKFVRELHRVLKPGGRACITVPNRASFQNLVALVTGRGERPLMDAYFTFEDFESAGKKAFYGFHWREYAPTELPHLFARAGFKVAGSGTFTAFQDHGKIGPGRKLARLAARAATSLLPRYGTHVWLNAVK